MDFSETRMAEDRELIISFRVPDDDWYLVRQSHPWRLIVGFLEECEKRGSQMSLTEKADLLEKAL